MSILGNFNGCQCKVKSFDTIEWRRASDIYKNNNARLFDRHIEGKSLIQGQLNNCYFVAALCAIAKQSDRIRDAFLTEDINDAGIYAVRLFFNGQQRTVVVDDYLPFDTSKHQVAFCRSTKPGEFWMCILEKAWAKLHGSYRGSESGQVSQVFSHLT